MIGSKGYDISTVEATMDSIFAQGAIESIAGSTIFNVEEINMSDPNLPEGVTQRDIDRTVGETFDPNNPYDVIERLQGRLENIKTLCGYMDSYYHPPVCAVWEQFDKKIVFCKPQCDCFISDIVHEVEMAEDLI